MTNTINQFVVGLLAFLIPYYGTGILMDWVDVYLLGHWDTKFGQSGEFYVNILLFSVMAVLACCGYIGGRILGWVCWRNLSFRQVNIIAAIGGMISSASWWSLILLDAPQWLTEKVLWPYAIAGPAIWIFVLSWLTDKISRRRENILDAT
jgi:hypothetical protein